MSAPITYVTFIADTETYPDRPFTAGDGNYGRSMDAFEGDAVANLTGAVTNEGLYQSITAFLTSLAVVYEAAYKTDGTPQQTSPWVMACMVRDALNTMIVQRSFVAR